jgi:ABC-2 type transport system permease protein
MTTAPTSSPAARTAGRAAVYGRAFWGLVLRDARVLVREFVSFLLRTVMNPLLFTFVFTYVLPKTGGAFVPGPGGLTFATILLPGLVAVAIFFQGIAAVALPLAIELGSTREIEDRVMAPLPVTLVGLEKVAWSAVQSIVAAAMVFPMVILISAEPVHVHVASWPILIAVVLLASFVAGFLGLLLGTIVKPRQIGLIFSLVVVPITFLGCVYYPWERLGSIRWLQIVTLVNPLVYVSEGLRAALTPNVPHMPTPVIFGALIALTTIFGFLSVASFRRRVID